VECSENNAPCLRVEDVGNDWLSSVSFELCAGECIVINGPSGVGKSILLRAIADLDKHTGKVSLDNQVCEIIPAIQWRKQVGLLVADSAWWGERVGEHMPELEPEQLAVLGFDEGVMDWSVDRLSTGEKQRLALLRVLVNKPKILLLDEPTANLDPGSVAKVEELLLEYCRSRPAGLVWVSHDPDQAGRVADRTYRLDRDGLKRADNKHD